MKGMFGKQMLYWLQLVLFFHTVLCVFDYLIRAIQLISVSEDASEADH